MKKILVTGASGFVGGYLVEEGLRRGYEVHAGLRATSSRRWLQDERIRFFIHDFNDVDQLTADLRREQFDYIIHNAGLTAAPNLDKLIAVNKGTLQNLVTACRRAEHMPKKVIYTSSLAAYGPADLQAGDRVELDSPPHPVTNYGRSKLAGETYLMEQADVPYLIIRPTAVYGPRDYEFLPVYKTVKMGLKVLPGLSDQKVTMIYVEDLARAFFDGLESAHLRKAYFATDGHVYTTAQLNDLVAQHLGKKPLTIKMPLPILKIVAALSETIGSWKGKYPVLNRDKVHEIKSRSWACDGDALKKDVNFVPSFDLSKGLKATLAWCKNENLI